jgi:HK97 family phage major capsid protein
MSPREEETIALFADTTGQPLRRPTALEGWRLATTSQLPTNIELSTADDTAEIFIGDFSLFTLFMREGISVQLLNELYAETGEVGFICHTRLDVAAMYANAFAVLQGVRSPAASTPPKAWQRTGRRCP